MQPTYTARLANGLIIHEDDILSVCESFPFVIDAANEGTLLSFSVEGEGFSTKLDYENDLFWVGDHYSPMPHDAQPIFYKHMVADSLVMGSSRCEYGVLGWQHTDKTVQPWVNQRLGVKLYFDEQRFLVTEDV